MCPTLSFKAVIKRIFLPYLYSIILLLWLSACSSPVPNTDLKNTHWSLIELRGQEVIHFDRHAPIHLLFHINDTSIQGNDGCNKLKADYLKTQNKISFKNIISTRRACEFGQEQSQNFLSVLQETDRLLIKEDEMFFYHKEVQIAHFEAKEDY